MRCVGAVVCSCVVYIRGRGCDQEQPVVMDDAEMVVDEEEILVDGEQPPQLLLTLSENNENFTPEIFKKCLECLHNSELSEKSKRIASFFFASIVVHGMNSEILVNYMKTNNKTDEKIKEEIGKQINKKDGELYENLNISLKYFLETIWSNLPDEYFEQLSGILSNFVSIHYEQHSSLFDEITDICYSFVKSMKTCAPNRSSDLLMQYVFTQVLIEDNNLQINQLLRDWKDKTQNNTMQELIAETEEDTEEDKTSIFLACVPWFEIRVEGNADKSYLNFLGSEISMEDGQNSAVILKKNSVFNAKKEMEDATLHHNKKETSDISSIDKALNEQNFNENLSFILTENANEDENIDEYHFREHWVITTKQGHQLNAESTDALTKINFLETMKIDSATQEILETNEDIQEAMQSTDKEVVIAFNGKSYRSPVIFLYNTKLIEKISQSENDEDVKQEMYNYMLSKITKQYQKKMPHQQTLIDALNLLITKTKTLQHDAQNIVQQYNARQTETEKPSKPKQQPKSKMYELVVFFWKDIIDDQIEAQKVVENLVNSYNTGTKIPLEIPANNL